MRRPRRLLAALVVVLSCAGPGTAEQPPTSTTANASTSTVAAAPARPACPPLGSDLDRVVRRFRAADGRCLAAGEASTYRCSATAPVPVAIVDGRRFVGGPYAAPATRPPTAVDRGAADDGVVIATDPADAGGVLVTSGAEGTERWPLVPSAPDLFGRPVEGGARPAVFLVGDSVILGAQPALAAAFADWSFTMDAAENRRTDEGLEVLRARRAEIADIVVVGLGYNDGGHVPNWTATVTQVLDDLASLPLVVWVNLREARGYYAEDNQVLRTMAAARPNLVIADWNAASGEVSPDQFSSDGLHLRDAAASAMATLVAGTVRGWLATHPDQGDQTCRPALETVIASGG